MTLYEQIQKALFLIESRLRTPLKEEDAAAEAGMSVRGFRQYFWMVTGYSYRDFVVGRRLALAAEDLSESAASILDIALSCGYESHEAFTRAFRKAFSVSPRDFRKSRPALKLLDKIELYKECYMGIVIKDFPEETVLPFTAFHPGAEDKAKKLLNEWVASHPAAGRPRRIFGHNVDAGSAMSNSPDCAGYSFFVSLSPEEAAAEPRSIVLKAGRFAVTGIEGSFENDPDGLFIQEGWKRMNAMIAEKAYRVKEGARWYEEELEPQKSGNLRLDLYLELE